MGSVYKRGKNWYIQYIYKGRQFRKSVGTTKKVATDALADMMLKIEREEHLGIIEHKKISFEEYGKKYLDYSKKTKRSWYRDETSLKRLASVFGDFKLDQITPLMIEDYISMRKEEESYRGQLTRPATINKELACMKTMYNRAIRDHMVRDNPGWRS